MARDAAAAILVAAIEAETLTAEELRFFGGEQPAGITLFGRNIPQSFVDFHDNLKSFRNLYRSSDLQPVIAIDQEGGRVARLKSPFPDNGPALSLKQKLGEDPQAIQNYGFTVGTVLRGFGINVNFAPVCDIDTNPKNHAIGDRAFGKDAISASEGAERYLSGLQASGVQGCLKHFPGQGDAGEDTHEKGTIISLTHEELMAREVLPFIKLCRQVNMVMISHAIYPAFDDKPASLSRKVIDGLLKKEMGFEGVVVSDDLNMKAIPQDPASWSEAICEAVAVGSDMLLVCRDLERCSLALSALRAAAAKSKTFAARLEDAAGKVSKLRKRLT